MNPPVPLSIRTTHLPGSVQVLHLRGQLDSLTGPLLGTALEQAERGPAQRIVIDLSGISFIASAGIGSLMAMHQRLRQARRSLHLAGATANVREVLALLGIPQVIPTHTHVIDALT